MLAYLDVHSRVICALFVCVYSEYLLFFVNAGSAPHILTCGALPNDCLPVGWGRGVSVGLQELEQLVQPWCHDDFRAAVVCASLGRLVGIHRFELSASAGLYLQGIDRIGLREDAYYAGGTNDTQVPVVLEDGGVDGHIVGVSLYVYVYLSLLVEHLGQLPQSHLTLLVYNGFS